MRTLIRAVRVFDGEKTVPTADVLIDGHLIAEPDDRPVDVTVDGTGRTLLPGLIDAHTHTFDGSLAEALTFGVTTELDMFCLPENLARQRALAASRDDVADLRSAGVLATAPGGHPTQVVEHLPPELLDLLGDAVGPFVTVGHPDQAAAFVTARVAEGVDYLKISIDHGLSAGTEIPVLAPDTVRVLVAAAREAGLRTIAHVASAADTAMALDAGVDGLAHVFADVLDPVLVGRIAEQNVFVVSTLTYLDRIAGDTGDKELLTDPHLGPRLSPGARAALAGAPGAHRPELRSTAMAVASAMAEAGVTLLAGTDATVFAPVHGASLHRELLLLTEAGLSAPAALTAATSGPADRFGLTDRGRVAPGLRADLLLVDGDPTTDISATRAIAGIWRRGTPRVVPT